MLQSIHLGFQLATPGGGLIRRAALIFLGTTSRVAPFLNRTLRLETQSVNPAEAGYQDLSHCHRVHRTVQPLPTLK